MTTPARQIPRRPRPALAALSLVALGGALGMAGGCTPSYSVEIRNATANTLDVQLVRDRLVDDPVVLEQGFVEPGRSLLFGPVRSPWTDGVRLEVTERGEMGIPPTRKWLHRGNNILDVSRAQDGWGPIRFTEVRE